MRSPASLMNHSGITVLACLFTVGIVLCGFDGLGDHAVSEKAAHHHSSACSILSGCQAETVSGRAGIPRLECDGPLVVSSTPRLSLLIRQLIDHPREFSA